MGAKFDSTFKLSAAALNLNLGHPSLPLTFKWLMQMCLYYVCYFPVFFSMLYSSIFYDGFTKICTNLSLAVVFLIISYNYGLLIVYRPQFNDMIQTIEEDLEWSKELYPEDEIVVKLHVHNGNTSSKIWLFVCVLCGGMFPCKAAVTTLYFTVKGNSTFVPILELTYPLFIEERKNELQVYIIIFCLQSYYVFFTTLMYIGFNSLGSIFIMHACGQIELVIKKVKRVFSKNVVHDEEAIEKLKDTARHIQRIYRFVDQIQQTHRALYEMCLITSMIAVPISCFGIIELALGLIIFGFWHILITFSQSYNQRIISIELIGFVVATLMQCYIPCYYCEVLLSKGEDLQVAIYGCGWEKHRALRSRTMILLMMTRAVRPLGIHAVFSTVRLEAFADLCNKSYTIFNVVNAAWN